MHHARESLPDGLRAALGIPETGATGRYPGGKLNDDDEGEIRIAVAADKASRRVLFDFGKPVAWIGFTAEQASDLADLLLEKSLELRGIDVREGDAGRRGAEAGGETHG